jgi:hypothetical protein
MCCLVCRAHTGAPQLSPTAEAPELAWLHRSGIGASKPASALLALNPRGSDLYSSPNLLSSLGQLQSDEASLLSLARLHRTAAHVPFVRWLCGMRR